MITEVALFAPNFVGLVQSSADLGSVTKALITFGRDFRILASSGSFAMIALGAHGAVDSIAKRTALRRPRHAVTWRLDALLDTLAAC
jgi:dihydrodipicolinate synthase/N-acetylneuraminate lyase